MPNPPLPPPSPAYILRGHSAPIHSAVFLSGNQRLITGDAEGWVVLWSLATKRPVAVWRAHEAVVLGVGRWRMRTGGGERVITHGKDNKLIVWRLDPDDESRMSTVLPVDDPPEPRRKPWVLYILDVNTLNFCSFASCAVSSKSSPTAVEGDEQQEAELLIAVPNILSSETVDIFHLPTCTRIHTVPRPSIPSTPSSASSSTSLPKTTGLIMSLSIFHHPLTQSLTLLTGYESGHTSVAQFLPQSQQWQTLYFAQPHTQPVLSLDVLPDRTAYFTGGADGVVGKHPIPLPLVDSENSLQSPTQSPLSLPSPLPSSTPSNNPKPKSLLTAAIQRSQSQSEAPFPSQPLQPPQPFPPPLQSSPTQPPLQTTPLTTLNTHHAGQQSLRIRTDGKILATAGWDGRVRVYATGKLREVAVLKWHVGGCFAVAFADLKGEVGNDDGEKGKIEGGGEGGHVRKEGSGENIEVQQEDGDAPKQLDFEIASQRPRDGLLSLRSSRGMTLRDQRIRKAETAHWVAVGGKDGKVSLWEIF